MTTCATRRLPPGGVQAIRRSKRRGEKKRDTSAAYIAAERVRIGRIPTATEVAKLFAISKARVEMHYRNLGLL